MSLKKEIRDILEDPRKKFVEGEIKIGMKEEIKRIIKGRHMGSEMKGEGERESGGSNIIKHKIVSIKKQT